VPRRNSLRVERGAFVDSSQPERTQQQFALGDGEGHAGDRFDEDREHCVIAVGVSVARSGREAARQPIDQRGDVGERAGAGRRLFERARLGFADEIAEAAGVTEQVADLEARLVGEPLRQIAADGSVELHAALLDQPEHQRRGELLADRIDRLDCANRRGRRRSAVGHAPVARDCDLVASHHDEHRPRDRLAPQVAGHMPVETIRLRRRGGCERKPGQDQPAGHFSQAPRRRAPGRCPCRRSSAGPR